MRKKRRRNDVNNEKVFQKFDALIETNNNLLNELKEVNLAFKESKKKDNEKKLLNKGVMMDLQVRFLLTFILVATMEVAILTLCQPTIYVYIVVGVLLTLTMAVWIKAASGLMKRTPEELEELHEYEKQKVDTIKLIAEFITFYAIILKLFS